MIWSYPGSLPTGIEGLQPSDLNDRIKDVVEPFRSGQLRSKNFKDILYGVIDMVRKP